VGTFAGQGKAGFLDGSGTGAQFNFPSGVVKYDKDNTFFVADYDNNRIRKVTSEGVVSTFAGNGADTSVDGQGVNATVKFPFGISIDQRNGNLFISEFGSGNIRKITPQAHVSTLATGLNKPRGLCCSEKDECLYIAESGKHAILKLDLKTGAIQLIAGKGKGYADGDATVARFDDPCGVAIESDTSLLVADSTNNRIRRITFTTGRTVVETVAGSGCGMVDSDLQISQFNEPYFLCVDQATSTCFVADWGNHRIRKFPLK